MTAIRRADHDQPLVPRTGWTLEDEYRALSAEFITVEENRDRLAEQLRGAVDRLRETNEALRVYLDHKERGLEVRPGWLEEEVAANDALLGGSSSHCLCDTMNEDKW
jgi:hypothetical protein